MPRPALFTPGPALSLLALPLVLTSLTPAHTQPRKVATQASTSAEDEISYVFRKGDTLYDLAGRYMEHRDNWRIVQQRNRIGNAHGIPPGTSIRIPTRLLKAEPLTARIIAFRGSGQLMPPSGASGPLATGQVLGPGMRLSTDANSFATIELSNGSRITLPSNTRIRIAAMRRFVLTGSVDFDFLVEQGRIETGVTPLKNAADRYRIRTPIATAAVRGTSFRVGYDGAQSPSLTEVIEGTVGVGTGNAPTAIPIEQGFGASASANGRIAREALLPPPELIEPGKVQVDPVVALRLSPVSGAQGYHVQIARDAGFVELEREATSSTPEVEFTDIPNGRWFLRATAIAQSGLEGMPESYAMRRVLTGLSASAEAGADGGWRFRWAGSGSGKRVYHFILRPEKPGAAALIDEAGLTTDAITLSDLPPGTYLWRVGVSQYEDGAETANWLPAQKLIVAPEPAAPR